MAGFVSGVHVVEGSVFTDNDDHVFDGSPGLVTSMLVSGCDGRGNQICQRGEQCGAQPSVAAERSRINSKPHTTSSKDQSRALTQVNPMDLQCGGRVNTG